MSKLTSVNSEWRWQLCPKCNGQGIVDKPQYVLPGAKTWNGTATSYPCDVCHGAKILDTDRSHNYKPLSEIHKDEESFRKVFEFIVGVYVEFGEVIHSNDNGFTVLYELKPGYYDESEPMNEVVILKNGSIYLMKGESVVNNYNVFALADFIRSLGHSA